MKWKNKKVGLSLLASVLLLSSLLGYQLALSSVPAAGPYYLDVPFGTASYYVGKFDNGTTYMVKGDTWQATWWSTNSSAIINACISNLTDGAIFFKSETYNVTDLGTYFDTTDKNLVLIGEDWESTVFLDSRTGETRTFSSTADLTPLGNITFRNIKFDRSIPSDMTVKYVVYGSWHTVRIEHCRFIGNPTIANNDTNHFLSVPFSGNIATDCTKNVYFIDNYIIDFQYGCVPVLCEYSEQRGNYIENAQTWALGAETSNIENGTYIITENTLINCAWYDEGIAIDSANPASPANTSSLIANNVIWNDESHGLVKGIAIVTANGVLVTNNKITNFGTEDYWGAIGVDSRDNCQLSNITIADNDIWSLAYRGIEIRGLIDGTVKGNVISPLRATGGCNGIRFTYSKALTYESGKINVYDNDVRLLGSSTFNYGIVIEKTAGSGGTIEFYVDQNIISSYNGLYTNAPDTLTVTLGENSWFDLTTRVTDDGAVKTEYFKNFGSSTGTGAEQEIAHGLVDTPDFVFFSDIEEGANSYLSSASNVTHIHVTAINGKDYAWWAVYEP